MRGVSVALLVAVLIAGCGGDGTSSTTGDSAAATTPAQRVTTTLAQQVTTAEPTTTVSVATADESTTTALSTTVAEVPVIGRAVLRPDGVGGVDFGTPADDAIVELTAVLGAPDRVEPIEPVFGDCVEGSSWLDCVQALRVIEEGRLAVWDSMGLEVALVDTDHDLSPAALHFGDWQATLASSNTRLTTPEGIYPGITVRALKQAVPGVEFSSNEGALDSFYTASPDGAGYWGRLDWIAATTDIDSVDVGAVQTALNEHGADLVVDGIWGPRSEVAWLAFLAENGVEPFTSQLWLTPQIAAALDLPPGEITVATIEPRPAIEPVAPVSAATPFLRTDGLGRFDFGEPAGELVGELTSLLGAPTDEVIFSAPPPDRLYMPGGYQALHELAQYGWADPQLLVIVGDTPYHGDRWDEPVPGSLHLITWETTSSALRFENGLRVGSTLQDLGNVHPDVTVGQWDVCETDYWPAEFTTAGPFGLRGSLDWDWVRDLQTALNERGAELDVDGIYGPATTDAVRTFQLAEGIIAEAPVDFGRAGPLTTAALGLVAPDSATIDDLAAGYRGSC